MAVESFTTLISTVGFPIACVIALFWRDYKDTEARREERIAERQQRALETDKYTTALNNNTLAIQKLIDMLQGGRKD